MSEERRAEAAFALTRLDGESQFRRRFVFIATFLLARHWDTIPNGAQHFSAPLVRHDKTGVARAAPALDVAGVFRLLEDVAWRRALGCLERLIEHVPK